MKPDLKTIHGQVIKLLPPLNDLLVKNFYRGVAIKQKIGSQPSVSVVTHLDQKIEKILHQKLAKIVPEAGFIGEETELKAEPDLNWVIDPIDGTLNFGSHIPVFAISVALWQENEPVYSLVSLPMQREVVHGFKDGGIFLNGVKQPVSYKKFIKPVIIYACVGGRDLVIRTIDTITAVYPAPPRAYGSCVFDGISIALRRIDAGVFINQALWDIGAITLLAQEAGLAVKYVSKQPNIAGDDLKNYQYSLVIGPEKLANDLAAKL